MNRTQLFPHKIYIPGFTNKRCLCGFQNYTKKYFLILCPEQEQHILFGKKIRNYQKLLNNKKKAKAAVKWLINTKILK